MAFNRASARRLPFTGITQSSAGAQELSAIAPDITVLSRKRNFKPINRASFGFPVDFRTGFNNLALDFSSDAISN